MNRIFIIGFFNLVSIVVCTQEIKTEHLLYARLNEDISHIKFNSRGDYVGVINDTTLVSFDVQNLLKSRYNLLKNKIGTRGNWYKLENLEYTGDTVITTTINGVREFLVKNDSLILLKGSNRSLHFPANQIAEYDKNPNAFFDITNFNGWFFYYQDLEKSGKKLKPLLTAVKDDRFENFKLPKVNIDFKEQSHSWFKNSGIVKAVYCNHFEKGKK